MGTINVQKTIPILLLGVALGGFSSLTAAQQQRLAVATGARARPVAFDIPQEPLTAALPDLGLQADLDIIFYADVAQGLSSPGLKGRYTAEQALAALLLGSGLRAEFTSSSSVVIRDELASKAVPTSQQSGANPLGSPQANSGSERLPAPHGDSYPASRPTSTGASTISEVIVSAEKRSENLQEVPVPVSVVNGVSLAANNIVRVRDFADTVPGFSVSPGPSGGNQQMVVIRGISSSAFGNPTVGVTVDDVPFGAFTREYSPDVDPSDLARVEVLRGPQGTLYGASSMGGLIKYVTVDPSTDRLSGRVEVGGSGVHGGDSIGYDARGAVNIPLLSNLAIRASAYTREDPGYIDNPILGKSDVNVVHANGGRLSGLWSITDQFSLKVSALYQHTKAGGLSEVARAPGLADLQQNYIAGTGSYDTKIEAYSATLNGKLGNVDVTSVTGYNVFDYFTVNDYTFLNGKNAQKFYGVPGNGIFDTGHTHKLSQEVRLVVPFGDRFDWLIGGFYTHEVTPLYTDQEAMNPITGAVLGPVSTLNIPISNRETAAFTDLTVQFTDQFDVQVGGRESFIHTDFGAVLEGGAVLPIPVTLPAILRDASVFTYLLTPRFKVSPDLMTYARISTGYRPSRANTFNTDPTLPRTADPDKTKNYEIGVKGAALDHVLSYDTSIYYIDWKDIQINLLSPNTGLSYYTNGSRAKSEGIEISLQAFPTEGLTLSGWGSYNRAEITEGFPQHTAAYGPAGSRLPYSPHWSGNITAEQRFPLAADITGFVGAAVVYNGDRLGTFVATPARAYYPAYTKLDLRTGAEFSGWLFNVYAKNVTDKRGLTGGGPGSFPPNAYTLIQPRTIGITAAKNF